jgi:TonB-dependent SusC/RagA subfamily outer membrane receptor
MMKRNVSKLMKKFAVLLLIPVFAVPALAGQEKIAANDTVYYVDGKEVSSIKDLNPDDIRSISVLKDKTAMEQYGKKGVVLIITEKYAQETGMKRKKPGISLIGGLENVDDKQPIRIGCEGPSPLIIIDEKEYSGDVKDLDPNEIESINVRKDSIALALYGEKGKNGVIIIATKAASGAKKHNP